MQHNLQQESSGPGLPLDSNDQGGTGSFLLAGVPRYLRILGQLLAVLSKTDVFKCYGLVQTVRACPSRRRLLASGRCRGAAGGVTPRRQYLCEALRYSANDPFLTAYVFTAAAGAYANAVSRLRDRAHLQPTMPKQNNLQQD